MVALVQPKKSIEDALQLGASAFVSKQSRDGSWSGVYGGPMFLLPMYVSARVIAKRPLETQRRQGFIRYLRAVQLADGSLGLHDEAEEGSLFTTTLGYVALRLLGVPDDDGDIARMRSWIRDHGGPLACPSWGKFVLCLLGLYKYDGLNPILPELWILPRQSPVHPGRMWCHSRQVYLPMAYLYGSRAQRQKDELTDQLRHELYDQPYESIDFSRYREKVSPTDQLEPTSWIAKRVNRLQSYYESKHSHRLRARALDELYRHICHEDASTNSIRIGPVNAVLNTLVHVFAEPESDVVERSFDELDKYIAEDPRGLVMNGYNSTALWDTAFAVQALVASPELSELHADALQRAHDSIRENQVLEDVPFAERHFRDPSRGGWPFSDRRHGWPITDCTAEGLKCALLLEDDVKGPVPEGRLRAAIELLLYWQNPNGGWASYERQRAGGWMEALNPSQVFSKIMVDHPYVECTAAVIQALAAAKARFPHLDTRLQTAIDQGEAFLRQEQRQDGSWEGSWGVCFTYGTWFGVWGLRAAGASTDDQAIARARRFLEEHQMVDGSWGEHYSSCLERRYVQHPEGQVVNTAWGLLTLCKAGGARSVAADRAAQFLLASQLENGDWPRQSMSGVFNRTTLIHYDNYRRYFPIWALALYRQAQRATVN